MAPAHNHEFIMQSGEERALRNFNSRLPKWMISCDQFFCIFALTASDTFLECRSQFDVGFEAVGQLSLHVVFNEKVIIHFHGRSLGAFLTGAGHGLWSVLFE